MRTSQILISKAGESKSGFASFFSDPSPSLSSLQLMEHKNKINFMLFIVFVLMFCASVESAAEGEYPLSVPQNTEENRWSFNVIPFYAWLPGQNGIVGALGTNTKLNLTVLDYLEHLSGFLEALDGLYMGTGELRYDKFGFLYDVFYMDLSSTAEIESRFVTANLDVGFTQIMTTLAGTYRLHQSKTGHIDALAGLRIRDVHLDLGAVVNIGGIISINGVASDGDTWIDPLLGAKGRYYLREKLYLSGWALVGGFDVASNFIWDVWTNINYEVSHYVDLFVGFRAEGTNYQSGSFTWDITQYGPMLGVTINLDW